MLQQAGRKLRNDRIELSSEGEDGLSSSKPTVTTREVRTAGDLNGLDGLVIPGGESTAIAKIASQFGEAVPGSDSDVFTALRVWMKNNNRPLWGTCAGLIFMANTIVGGEKKVSCWRISF
jgi:glutamine amidotransferase PdxT